MEKRVNIHIYMLEHIDYPWKETGNQQWSWATYSAFLFVLLENFIMHRGFFNKRKDTNGQEALKTSLFSFSPYLSLTMVVLNHFFLFQQSWERAHWLTTRKDHYVIESQSIEWTGHLKSVSLTAAMLSVSLDHITPLWFKALMSECSEPSILRSSTIR